MTLYKNKDEQVYYSEVFFNQHCSGIDLSSEESALIMEVMEKARYLGNREVMTRYGKGKVKYLSTSTKLALCLVNFSAFVFDTRNIPQRDLVKILLLPRGRLKLLMKEPLPFYFELSACTEAGETFRSSTEVNIWYFGNKELL